MSARSGLIALAATPVLAFAGLLGVAVIGEEQPAAAACGGSAARSVLNGQLPARVGAFSGAQLEGAAQIMLAAKDAGLPLRAQQLAVTAAIGESTLTAVDHGDLAGPDSLGWFQQRDPWGPRADRLDAYKSATMFLTGGQGGQKGLKDIPGWEALAPTIAIHRVQINADPYHYEKFWADGVAIVDALSGATGGATVQLVSAAGAVPCGEGGSSIPVPAGSWGRPVTGPVTSGFGPRWGTQHNGIDFGAPCGTPTYAVADGTVVMVAKNNVSPATGYGTLVAIDHGGGVVTRYAHANNQDVLVTVGQQLKAGQQVTRVGTYGDSTGCHLHFEVQQGGKFVDPAPLLTAHSVAL